MSILLNYDVAFLCLCVGIHLLYRYYRRISLPLPPGPRRWPVVGNAFSLPRTRAHMFYKDLGERLGTKIMYLEAFGQKLLVLNDAGMAQDLLEKRSALYSDRPQFRMVTEVAGIKHFFVSMPYGDEWRSHRRIFQQYFSKNLDRVREKGLEFVHKGLLPNLYADPSNFRKHIRSCIGGFSTSVTYGLPVKRLHDPLVERTEKTFHSLSAAASPGKYLVNIVPFLKYIPEWVPGASFQKDARQLRQEVLQLMEDPYEMALKMTADGTQTASISFVVESLEAHQQTPDDRLHALHVKQAAAQIFNAIMETTLTSTLTFVLAMLKNPSVQRRAQQEIDSVIGDRLPEFSDMPHLPYFSAIIKEVLRWNPIAPLGLPHRTSDEDVYNGYYIPKGCTVFANAYAMLHDEEVFPEADKFIPERFVKNGTIRNDIPNPEVVATFGFGRRICPGSQVGLSMVYFMTSSILALFDIVPDYDVDGRPIEITAEFAKASLVSEPLPFPCKFIPRKGKDVESLLEDYMGVEVI